MPREKEIKQLNALNEKPKSSRGGSRHSKDVPKSVPASYYSPSRPATPPASVASVKSATSVAMSSTSFYTAASRLSNQDGRLGRHSPLTGSNIHKGGDKKTEGSTKSGHKNEKNDRKPKQSLREELPIRSQKSRGDKVSTGEQPHHGGENRDDVNDGGDYGMDDGKDDESNVGSVHGSDHGSNDGSDDERPRESKPHTGSVGGSERSSGSTRTKRKPQGWERKSSKPPGSEKGSKPVVGHTRPRVRSSTSNDGAGDDKGSGRGSQIGDGESRKGDQGSIGGDGGRDVKPSSRSGKRNADPPESRHGGEINRGPADDVKSLKSLKKGSSDHGGNDVEQLVVSDRQNVAFSGADKDQEQQLEPISEGPSDDEESYYSEEKKDRRTRGGAKEFASFLRKPEKRKTIPKDEAVKGKLYSSNEGFAKIDRPKPNSKTRTREGRIERAKDWNYQAK